MTERLAHCYIYYRIAAPHAAAARAAILATLRAMEERCGIAGRLYEGESEPLLWMEVYENVHDKKRFEMTLNDLLSAHRFASFLAPGSERRIERFVSQRP
ncbi:MAG TPA: DUF4936 family protein [Casimicrobiaceae bacterium]|nr:DUF4936 family protein [Casimicrobiaceae bacterium]